MLATLNSICPLVNSCEDSSADRTDPISIRRFDRTADVPVADWEAATDPDSVFLQLDYLRVLDTAGPRDVTSHFAIIYRNQRPIGVAVLQQFVWRTDRSLMLDKTTEDDPFSQRVRAKIARRAHVNMLLLGNLLLTGERAFHFLPEVDGAETLRLLQRALDETADHFREMGKKIHVFFYKDFAAKRHRQLEFLRAQPALELTFSPNMVQHLRREWETMDDYLAALTSKYRKRYRRARRKMEGIERRELTLAEIEQHTPRLFELYGRILERVSFNMMELTPDYFLTLARTLGDRFYLTGYFDGEALVGFSSTVLNGQELEAHFVGLDERYNASHQLYLNMLFDFLERAIERPGVAKIHFARTAYTIKSSLGAVPETYYSYLQMRNSWAQTVFTPLYRFMEPPEEQWEQRHPFGDTE